MAEEMQEPIGSSTYIAIVAPVWLQNALLVFLHSTPALKLVACTATVQVLLALDLDKIPELIIIETEKDYRRAQDQIERIKAAWPASHVIALIPDKSLRVFVQAAGATEVLVSGTSPEQLRQAIAQLTHSDKDALTGPL